MAEEKGLMEKMKDMATKPYRDYKDLEGRLKSKDREVKEKALQDYRDMQPKRKRVADSKQTDTGAAKYKNGGSVSKRADGCVKKGKTKGRMV
jgi:hypothetical protein